MSIRLVCPACQHPHQVSEARLEDTIRCKHCGKTIHRPAWQTSAAEDEQAEGIEVVETSDPDDEPDDVFPSTETSRTRPKVARGNRRTVMVIVGLVAAGAVSIAVCCGGLLHFGFETMAEEVRVQLEADRRFTAHVGQIQKLELEFTASIVDDDDDLWTYNVTGTKWSGRIQVKQQANDDWTQTQQIVWVRFTLASGEKVELPWPDPADAADEKQDGEKQDGEKQDD